MKSTVKTYGGKQKGFNFQLVLGVTQCIDVKGLYHSVYVWQH